MEEFDYKTILKKNYDYWQITEEEYNKRKNELNNKFSFNDIIWSLLNDKIQNNLLKKDYSEVRNMILVSAKFLEKEKKIALYQYIEILLYDICLEYQLINRMKEFDYIKSDIKTRFDYKTFFVLNIVEKIQKYKKDYNKIDLEKIYSTNPMEKPILFEKFNNIIEKIINEDFDVEKYNKLFTEKFA